MSRRVASRIQSPAFVTPPTTDRGHGKTGRIVIGSHVHKTRVPGQIVNAVRISPGHRRIGKIVVLHLFSRPLATPLPPFVFKVSNQLLLLGVHRNDRLALPQRQLHLPVDVPELGVPVRMVVPFLGLPVALQAVIHLPQQLRHLFVADGVSLAGQFVRQRPGALAGPAQRRLRIAPRQRLDQGLQQRGQLGIMPDQRMPSAARTADAFRGQGGRIQFLNALHDGDPGQPAGPADQRHSAVAQSAWLRQRPACAATVH